MNIKNKSEHLNIELVYISNMKLFIRLLYQFIFYYLIFWMGMRSENNTSHKHVINDVFCMGDNK